MSIALLIGVGTLVAGAIAFATNPPMMTVKSRPSFSMNKVGSGVVFAATYGFEKTPFQGFVLYRIHGAKR